MSVVQKSREPMPMEKTVEQTGREKWDFVHVIDIEPRRQCTHRDATSAMY